MKVVGLTGSICSGKTTVRKLLEKFLSQRGECKSLVLSDVLKSILKERGEEITRENLQNLGNELRKGEGPSALVKLSLENLESSPDFLIIDGIRNLGEVEYLKERFGKDFVLVAVDAPFELRYRRWMERKRSEDVSSLEEFRKVNDRDLGIEEPPWGQRVIDCMKVADCRIVNEGSLESLEEEIKKLVEKILQN